MKNIRQIVRLKGYRLNWFCDQLGISYDTLRNYELGITTPKKAMVDRAEQILNVKFDNGSDSGN